MAAPTQPTQLGDTFAVNFSGAYAPTTVAYIPEDGWNENPDYALKEQVEDLAGNARSRLFAGKEKRFSGTMFVPAGTAPQALKPGDTFSLTPVVNGEVTGTAVVYCVVSAKVTGNRQYDKLDLEVVKENSMTYT